MKAKRIICLLLAILMVMGTVTWLITLIASADDKPLQSSEVVTGYSLEKVYSSYSNASKDNFCYEKGNKDKPAYAIKKGYYADFKVALTMTFESKAAAQQFLRDNGFTVTDDSISGGEFKVSVDSGSFSSGKLSAAAVQNDKIKLTESKGDGILTVYITITKVCYSGENNLLGFTLYSEAGDYYKAFDLAVSQCEPYKASSSADDDDDDDTDIPDPTPYVIVSAYNYGGGNVTAGQEFTLNLTIENTSSINVGNMTMTISTPDAFTLVNSSNTVYIESLPAHDTLAYSIRMMARASADPEPAALEIGFDYQYIADGTRKDVSRAERISIPVSQRDRFQIEDLVLPTTLWVGEEYDLEVKYINKGRSTVYNLSARLEGEGLSEPNQSDNAGNIDSGKSGNFDFFLMTYEPGILSGNVVVTYEDVNMNEKTVTLPYSIPVESYDEPVYDDPSADYVYNDDGTYYGPDGVLYGPDGLPVEEKAGWVTWAIVGGCALAGVVVLVVVKKKRKAARLLAELEEDNNEDI